MQTGKCPLCQSDIIIDDEVYTGDLVDCANCSQELEVKSLNPLQIIEMDNDSTEEDN